MSRTAERQAKKQSGLAAFGAALAFLRRTPFLSMLFVLSFLGNFAVGGVFEIATPLLFKERVGVVAGPQAFGLAVAGFGLGSIIGAVAAGVASNLRHKAVISLVAILPSVVCVSAVPFSHGTLTMAALFAGVGLFLGISNVLIITVVQTLIPLDMMGRMMSLVMLGSLIGTPLSIFAYGAAATIIPSPLALCGWFITAGHRRPHRPGTEGNLAEHLTVMCEDGLPSAPDRARKVIGGLQIGRLIGLDQELMSEDDISFR